MKQRIHKNVFSVPIGGTENYPHNIVNSPVQYLASKLKINGAKKTLEVEFNKKISSWKTIHWLDANVGYPLNL